MIKAKDTVMKEREVEYNASCGQIICCDILPKYLAGDVAVCYREISIVVKEFVQAEREVQAEITGKIMYDEGKKAGFDEGLKRAMDAAGSTY